MHFKQAVWKKPSELYALTEDGRLWVRLYDHPWERIDGPEEGDHTLPITNFSVLDTEDGEQLAVIVEDGRLFERNPHSWPMHWTMLPVPSTIEEG